eukprot:1192041-Rhodomonas_salina.1
MPRTRSQTPRRSESLKLMIQTPSPSRAGRVLPEDQTQTQSSRQLPTSSSWALASGSSLRVSAQTSGTLARWSRGAVERRITAASETVERLIKTLKRGNEIRRRTL